MKIIEERPVTVYRYDGQYGTSYSIGVSKKNQDGTYTKAFKPCKFRKDVELENKTEIYLEDAWEDFYQVEKKIYWYVFINKFRKKEENTKNVKEKEEQPNRTIYAKDIEITNEDLPF